MSEMSEPLRQVTFTPREFAFVQELVLAERVARGPTEMVVCTESALGLAKPLPEEE